PRPTSRTRFHILSQLPSQSRSRSRSPFRPPPIKPRRIYQQQQKSKNCLSPTVPRPSGVFNQFIILTISQPDS
ncbi:unnamed protein product, partial [Rotaria sp. Silwood1]